MDKLKVRKLINDLHLWMGLSSGVILFIVCLSGTIYTFRSEVERWMEPEKYYSDAVMSNRLTADILVARIETIYNGKVTAVNIPSEANMNWQFTVKKSDNGKDALKAEGAGSRPKTYFVNPSTGQVEGEQGGSTSEFFTTMMQLHRWLLMEKSGGKIIVGVATIIFVFIILSGLILWFPAKLRLLRQVLTIKTSANWKRINHDLHNTLGFYSFLILLIMALTGLCWSFEWYRDGLSNVLGAKVFRARGEKPLQSKIPAEATVTAAFQGIIDRSQELFLYPGNLRLSVPENDTTAITVTKTATGFFASTGADKAQFDQYSGEPLKVELFADKPLNVKIADSIKPIHTGEIFGTFSKIIYFIVCLIATSLPVTGTMIWLNKMKKNNKPAKKRAIKDEQLA